MGVRGGLVREICPAGLVTSSAVFVTDCHRVGMGCRVASPLALYIKVVQKVVWTPSIEEAEGILRLMAAFP